MIFYENLAPDRLISRKPRPSGYDAAREGVRLGFTLSKPPWDSYPAAVL